LKIVRTGVELDEDLDRSKTIGFVPTMGALHEGHLSLMRAAKAANDVVVASIFVNPTQFGPTEDFARYPRNEQADSELANEAGVDFVFVPTTEEVYPTFDTSVRVAGVSEKYEGEFRQGHFDGVATVVCKLLNLVCPTAVYFGRKDLQQCAVVRRMVLDMRMPVRVEILPTVREASGLALSSRNVYLSEDELQIAPNIYETLSALAEELKGLEDIEACADALENARNRLSSAGFEVQYLDLVDADTFTPMHAAKPGGALIFAGYLGGTRLIDNVPLYG
jgi:pantoate--beta-alanine ligase